MDRNTMTVAEFRRYFARTKQQEWLLDSDKQPGYWVGDPISCKLVCKIKEVWPENNIVVLDTEAGEIVLCRVELVEVFTGHRRRRTVCRIRCKAGIGEQRSFTLQLESYRREV